MDTPIIVHLDLVPIITSVSSMVQGQNVPFLAPQIGTTLTQEELDKSCFICGTVDVSCSPLTLRDVVYLERLLGNEEPLLGTVTIACPKCFWTLGRVQKQVKDYVNSLKTLVRSHRGIKRSIGGLTGVSNIHKDVGRL